MIGLEVRDVRRVWGDGYMHEEIWCDATRQKMQRTGGSEEELGYISVSNRMVKISSKYANLDIIFITGVLHTYRVSMLGTN